MKRNLLCIYRGKYVGNMRPVVIASTDGKQWDRLMAYNELVNHSPDGLTDGFNWGYHGSGPAQLAFAILIHYLMNSRDMEKLPAYYTIEDGMYQAFKRDHVATWGDEWEIRGDAIEEWMQGYLAERLTTFEEYVTDRVGLTP